MCEYIHGIGDASQNDGVINWDIAAMEGCRFAIIRAATTGAWATIGGKYRPKLVIDTMLRPNYDGAAKAGLARYLYAWFDPRTQYNSGAAQAENYLQAVEGLSGWPVLDLEQTGSIRAWNGVGKEIVTWLRAVEQETGKRPLIYTNADFVQSGLWNSTVQETWLMRYGLIVAHWGAPAPRVPAPWHPLEWVGWQYTASAIGKVYGFGRSACCLAIMRADAPGLVE